MDGSLFEGINPTHVLGAVMMVVVTGLASMKKKKEENSSSENFKKLNIVDKGNGRAGELLQNLSRDILTGISLWLNTEDILSLSCVSCRLYDILRDDFVWEQLWLKRYSSLWRDFAYLRDYRSIYWDPLNNWGPPLSGWLTFYLEFEYSWANWLLAGCNNKEMCYLCINSKIYDVTKFVPEHPGSGETLLEHSGGDVTQVFNDISHSTLAKILLNKYFIGKPQYEAVHADFDTLYTRIRTEGQLKEDMVESMKDAVGKLKTLADVASNTSILDAYGGFREHNSNKLQVDAKPSMNIKQENAPPLSPSMTERFNSLKSQIPRNPNELYNKIVGTVQKTTNILSNFIEVPEIDNYTEDDYMEALNGYNGWLKNALNMLSRALNRYPQQKSGTKPENARYDGKFRPQHKVNLRDTAFYALEVEKLAIMNYISNKYEWVRQVSQVQSKITTLQGHSVCYPSPRVADPVVPQAPPPEGGPVEDNPGNQENPGTPGIAQREPSVLEGNTMLEMLGRGGVHCGQPRLFYDPLTREWTLWWSCCAFGEPIDYEIIQAEKEKLPLINSSTKRLSSYLNSAVKEYITSGILRNSSIDDVGSLRNRECKQSSLLHTTTADGFGSSSTLQSKEDEERPKRFNMYEVSDDFLIDEDEHVFAEFLCELGLNVLSPNGSRQSSVDRETPQSTK